jgi:hypothetical protein
MTDKTLCTNDDCKLATNCKRFYNGQINEWQYFGNLKDDNCFEAKDVSNNT